ncbi:sensor histidine kinase [Oceanobacillus jeddahense]|uniref:histidine kinase n=1 Tax=Oceanobacillus jeddahense TaxID=1462527 RepID=A0ABY5JLM1_9BACI|nr:HAMP domain-containing sensor histidine kinase [Oceanobacillus jeddahense]UUI01206.1 ATP-binding protein [Oceanobacillus jeddahense]
MRLGVRGKLILSFSSMLMMPVVVVLASGVYSKNSITFESILPILLAFLIPFVIGAMITGWVISRNILTPLDELGRATKNIREGNLDFVVSYQKNDEMGDLSHAFDEMKDQLKELREKQAAHETARKELIASISHDLRTPMSSIKGYVEGLQDGIIHDKERFQRYIAVIKNKTENLDHLIEALFQYSQLDIRTVEESFSNWNSNELLETIIQPMEIEFLDDPIQLKVIKPFPEVSLFVNADELAQVFDNLVGNAKRYVGEGGKIIIRTNTDKYHLNVSVTDNGTGIAQEDLRFVFDQFYRVEKSRSRNFGGAGLGLAICKKIIEKHNGEIWVESEVDIGTSFYFTIPIAKK